jgi:type I restriction enzyme S subunit
MVTSRKVTNMSKEKALQPALRFSGFKDDWCEKSLGQVLSLVNGFAFKSEYFCKYKTGYEVLTPGSVNISGGFQYGKGQNYKLDGKIPKKFIFNAGDIFITMTDLTPTAQMLGLPAIVPNDGITYLHNQRLGKLVEYQGDYGFLFYLLGTHTYRKHIVTTSSGTTVRHSSPEKVQNSKNYFPANLEQKSIGSYFQEFDQQLKLHQAKHSKLQQLKKAMLGKMFPKTGAKVPELRFAGFSEDWETKILGLDIANIIGGGTPNTMDYRYWNGDIDWYSPTEIGSSPFAYTSTKKVTQLGLDSSSAKRLPAEITILFTSRAGIGDMAILKKAATTNQGFQSLVLKEGFDTYFIYSMGHLIKDYAMRNASGSTFLEITGKLLGKMEIKIPFLAEQTKIGEYFQNLDRLIALQQQQIDKLKNIKQSCLEKMFV